MDRAPSTTPTAKERRLEAEVEQLRKALEDIRDLARKALKQGNGGGPSDG